MDEPGKYLFSCPGLSDDKDSDFRIGNLQCEFPELGDQL